jgi:hypothetical protein
VCVWGGGTRVMTGGRDIILADFAPRVGDRRQEIVFTGAGMGEVRVRGCVGVRANYVCRAVDAASHLSRPEVEACSDTVLCGPIECCMVRIDSRTCMSRV